MDTSNPAVSQYLAVHPKALAELADDPEAARPLYRNMSFVNACELFNERENLTFPQRLELSKEFARLGLLDPKNAAQTGTQGNGFSIQIIFPDQKTPSVTATAPAVRVDDVEDADVVDG